MADVRRINGFYCRCLQVIVRIQPSYISRISNIKVLQEAGKQPIAKRLLRERLLLYGRVARAPAGDELRKRTFKHGTLRPLTQKYVRRIGRPRNEWASQIEKHAVLVGAEVHGGGIWKAAVSRYCM